MDLTEQNVNALFTTCLATKLQDKNNILVSELFQKAYGYKENAKPIFFQRDKIQSNKKTIEFLAGQLKNVHDKKRVLTAKSAIQKYNGVNWTTDSRNINEVSSFM